jgi:hypothetical protein
MVLRFVDVDLLARRAELALFVFAGLTKGLFSLGRGLFNGVIKNFLVEQHICAFGDLHLPICDEITGLGLSFPAEPLIPDIIIGQFKWDHPCIIKLIPLSLPIISINFDIRVIMPALGGTTMHQHSGQSIQHIILFQRLLLPTLPNLLFFDRGMVAYIKSLAFQAFQPTRTTIIHPASPKNPGNQSNRPSGLFRIDLDLFFNDFDAAFHHTFFVKHFQILIPKLATIGSVFIPTKIFL